MNELVGACDTLVPFNAQFLYIYDKGENALIDF